MNNPPRTDIFSNFKSIMNERKILLLQQKKLFEFRKREILVVGKCQLTLSRNGPIFRSNLKFLSVVDTVYCFLWTLILEDWMRNVLKQYNCWLNFDFFFFLPRRTTTTADLLQVKLEGVSNTTVQYALLRPWQS